MKVLHVLLLSIVTIVSTQQPQLRYVFAIDIYYFEFPNYETFTECFNRQLFVSDILEYCYHGEWRWICHDDSQWNQERTISACTQLGYKDDSGKLVVK